MRYLLLALILFPLAIRAQEPLKPALRQELWTSIGVRGRVPTFLHPVIGDDIIRNLRLSADLGFRSADVFFAGRQVYIDLGAKYKLSDLVSVGIEQRVAFRPDGTTRNRTGLMVDLSHDIERLELGYRFNYQHNYLEWGDEREVFRNRFEAGYNIPSWKLDPVFTVEFFTWAGYQGLSYFGTRYKLGTEWSPGKGQSFQIALIHDRQRDVAWPQYRTILSVDYVLYLNKF
jgi:hypothetical protein